MDIHQIIHLEKQLKNNDNNSLIEFYKKENNILKNRIKELETDNERLKMNSRQRKYYQKKRNQ